MVVLEAPGQGPLETVRVTHTRARGYEACRFPRLKSRGRTDQKSRMSPFPCDALERASLVPNVGLTPVPSSGAFPYLGELSVTLMEEQTAPRSCQSVAMPIRGVNNRVRSTYTTDG